MTDPQEMLAWLDRRIASVTLWLEQHGRESKKPRSIDLIEIKEEDLAKFEEMRGAYLRACAKRQEDQRDEVCA